VSARRLAAFGGEERPKEGGEHRLLLAAGVAQGLAQEWTEQRCQEQPSLADRLLEAGGGVGGDQLHSAQAALDERTKEPRTPPSPPRPRRGRSPPGSRTRALIGEHEALTHDTAAVADLLDLGVHSLVGVATIQRLRKEGLHPLVEALVDAQTSLWTSAARATQPPGRPSWWRRWPPMPLARPT
jgi:hypothetical protein